MACVTNFYIDADYFVVWETGGAHRILRNGRTLSSGEIDSDVVQALCGEIHRLGHSLGNAYRRLMESGKMDPAAPFPPPTVYPGSQKQTATVATEPEKD